MRTIPESELTLDLQKHLRDYEAGYDLAQASIRRAAAIWVLAPFAALAILVTDQQTQIALETNQYSEYFILTVIGFLGTVGLFVLWVADQMVYQSLLHSIFVLGIRIEHLNKKLLPIRTLLYTTKHNVSWKLSLFYAVPIFFLILIPTVFPLLTPADAGSAVEGSMASHVPTSYEPQRIAAWIMTLTKGAALLFILIRPLFEGLSRRYARNYGTDFANFMGDRKLRKRELHLVTDQHPARNDPSGAHEE